MQICCMTVSHQLGFCNINFIYSKVMQLIINKLKSLSNEASTDLTTYLQRCGWLNEIWQFCQAWDGEETIRKWNGTEVSMMMVME